jgi:hypothetical protein
LDIYVRALFNDIYDGNWYSTIDYNGVPAERQCKALANFFVEYIFGQNQPLFSDCIIDNNFSNNVPDYVLQGSATTIFNSMSNPIHGNVDDAQEGDVWVKDINLTCDSENNYLSGYNHYGLYFDDSSIIDANWSGNGRLQIAPTRDQDKVVRPE